MPQSQAMQTGIGKQKKTKKEKTNAIDRVSSEKKKS